MREPAGLPPVPETELDRIVKLIPTELLAFYTAATPVLGAITWRYFTCALFALGLVLSPLILYLDGRSTARPAAWSQYVARTAIFASWAMAIVWPFSPWLSGDALRWPRSACVLLVPLVSAMWLRDRPLAMREH